MQLAERKLRKWAVNDKRQTLYWSSSEAARVRRCLWPWNCCYNPRWHRWRRQFCHGWPYRWSCSIRHKTCVLHGQHLISTFASSLTIDSNSFDLLRRQNNARFGPWRMSWQHKRELFTVLRPYTCQCKAVALRNKNISLINSFLNDDNPAAAVVVTRGGVAGTDPVATTPVVWLVTSTGIVDSKDDVDRPDSVALDIDKNAAKPEDAELDAGYNCVGGTWSITAETGVGTLGGAGHAVSSSLSSSWIVV